MRLSGLWLHTEFRKLWAGQASTLFASQLMFLALPLTAVTVLDATPFQMGVVTAMAGLPAVFGLFMGSWADRRRRLPVIVASDIGRALLLAVIPITHMLGALTIEVIYAVAFGVGAMSILFQIAYRSFLPSVVKKEQLVEANSKLEFATSGAGSIGPAIGGFLVQALTAPFALLFGTGFYLLSGLMFRRIKVDEPDPVNVGQAATGGIREGLRFFRRNHVLIGIGGASATLILFSTAFEAVSLIYMVRVLGLSAGTIGLLIAAASVGLFLGAGLSSRYASRIGVGKMATIGLAAIGLGDLALPIAGGPVIVIAVIVVAGGIMTEAGFVVFNIGQLSIKQSITPDRLQGRVTSILVVVTRASIPVGGLLGGVLGEWLGLRPTLFIGGFGMITAALWLVYFRVWTVRSLADPAEVG